jgi:pseudouridine-5'-phosphate glycosidase
MRIAALAGIEIFATGGIGGVHRGVERSFDISADLSELAHTPVAVICAGAKSILDIPKTLEFLETLRVPVIAYGTDEFPAFYSNASGVRAPEQLDTPGEIAEAILLHRRLGSGTGLLIANPIPVDAALAGEDIDGAIEAATREAEAQGVGGKALTPFLLSRINELSGGASLKANIALIRNNAALAARVAAAYAGLARTSR